MTSTANESKWTRSVVLALAISFGVIGTQVAKAADTVTGEVKEAAKNVRKGAKKAVRAADDATCPDGKAKCAVKKGVHKVEDAVESKE